MDRLDTLLSFLDDVDKEELIDWLAEKKHPRHRLDDWQVAEAETLVEAIQGSR